MKKKYLLLVVLALYFFTGCEQSVGDEEFPYKAQIVINGMVENGKQIKDIYIGRTLPIGVKYSASFAAVTNADVVLSVDNQYYPMKHTTEGLYSCNLVAETGKLYSIIVNWEDKLATAQTMIPLPGTVIGGKVTQKTESGKILNIIEATISPIANETYAITWTVLGINGAVQSEATEFNEVSNAKNSVSSGNVKVTTADIPKNYLSFNLGIKMYIYDEVFYDYYKTQNSNKVSDAIFGQSGTSVKWNVKGEGIGMFIGKNIVGKDI